MANSFDDLEELAQCSNCKLIFDETERPPKILSCQHHFCLPCIRTMLDDGLDVRCIHCCKHTELPDALPEALPTHNTVLILARRLTPDPQCSIHLLPALCCVACGVHACRSCDHAQHSFALRPFREARSLVQRESRFLTADLERLHDRQHNFLLRVIGAATALKVRIETVLLPMLTLPLEKLVVDTDNCLMADATAERGRLRTRYSDALLQCRIDDLIRNSTVPLDFDMFQRVICGLRDIEIKLPNSEENCDSELFLANYCMAQFFSRKHQLNRMQSKDICNSLTVLDENVAQEIGTTNKYGAIGSPLHRSPPTYPLFYFYLEVNSTPVGRIVIEVRDDIAPRMARNFAVLATGELGVGYRGCKIFKCWVHESVITGDFETNNGRGGRSIYQESFFMPDTTKIVAARGAVGMRRTQKRQDNFGLVGSQFRIILSEKRGFSAIFAYVVEGLDLIDQLSRSGDSAGKPHSTIIISSCGKLN